MKKKFVIRNFQRGLPFDKTILYTFLLWYFKVDNLYWGIFLCFMVVLWLLRLYIIFNYNHIDLNDLSDDSKNKNNLLNEKMKDLLEKAQKSK